MVFADVEDDTANLDPAAAEAAVTAAHQGDRRGRLRRPPGRVRRSCARSPTAPGALLLADAAHSIGSTYRGRPVGSLADLTTFSFFPTKNLTTAEGGAVAAPDPDAAASGPGRFRTIGLVRDRGRLRYPDEGGWHQEVHEFGLNYRLPDVLCALGSSQLRRLRRVQGPPRRAGRPLRRAAGRRAGPAAAGPQRPWVDPAWHLYPVRVLDGRRREVYDRMRAAGIGVQVNYIPAYWHPVFADLGYRRGHVPGRRGVLRRAAVAAAVRRTSPTPTRTGSSTRCARILGELRPVHHANHFYGHAHVLARYCGLDDRRTRRGSTATCSTAGTSATGSRPGTPYVAGQPDLRCGRSRPGAGPGRWGAAT